MQICLYRFLRNSGITFMHCDGRCSPAYWREPPRFGATQHGHFQRHHSKIGATQPRHDFAHCFQSCGHSDIRCMEIERFAKESRHRIGYQSRFFALPFFDVTTIEHCTDIVSWLDYWRAWRLKRFVIFILHYTYFFFLTFWSVIDGRIFSSK